MVKKFVLQWHITENCNLKCKHCYQDNKERIQLKKEELVNILEQYKELLRNLKMKGHINITGGEPLSSPFFFDLLDQFKKDKDLYSFSILTNGTLINETTAKRISEYNPSYVQVSLEGGMITNDYIRGKGTYKKIAEGIKNLKRFNIFVSISFTANKLNYKEFPKVVKYALKNNVNNLWSDRYIPIESDGSIKPLNLKETNEYLSIMQNERIKLKNRKNCNTTISMYRALQFQMTNDFPYACTAGDTLLTVMENGDLVPCRRMPILVGNLLKDNMYELYKNNEIIKELRGNLIPDDCGFCEHEKICKGGLKCLTYAIYGDLNHKDCGCNIKNK